MKTERSEIDERDRYILQELKKNCKRSYRELSKAVGMSPAALIERVKRLEEKKIIAGYSADLNSLALGYEFMAVVKITISRGALLEIQKKIGSLKGVAAVYDVTGDYDSIAIVMCKTRGELSRLIKSIINLPYVQKTNTNIVLNVVKEFHEFSGV